MFKISTFLAVFLIGFFAVLSSQLSAQEDPVFAKAREEMVIYQIEARGIDVKDVLAAMRKVQRHKFVPKALQPFAYTDRPLPIGSGQTISQPYIVALMTSILNLTKDEKVLEVGTGSGYQAAILAELAEEVYSIEIIPELAESADKRLKTLGYTNIKVKTGDGYLGWPEYAPFDAIIVTAAPDEVPRRLVEQLKEGGRMVLPLAEGYQQKLIKIEKKGNKITEEHITDVMFVPMIHGSEE